MGSSQAFVPLISGTKTYFLLLISGTKFLLGVQPSFCPAYIRDKRPLFSRLYQGQTQFFFLPDISGTTGTSLLPLISGTKFLLGVQPSFCPAYIRDKNLFSPAYIRDKISPRGPAKLLSRLYQGQKTSFLPLISGTDTIFGSPCYNRVTGTFWIPLISGTKYLLGVQPSFCPAYSRGREPLFSCL